MANSCLNLSVRVLSSRRSASSFKARIYFERMPFYFLHPGRKTSAGNEKGQTSSSLPESVYPFCEVYCNIVRPPLEFLSLQPLWRGFALLPACSSCSLRGVIFCIWDFRFSALSWRKIGQNPDGPVVVQTFHMPFFRDTHFCSSRSVNLLSLPVFAGHPPVLRPNLF